ncbi:hypothetical protein TRVL_09605 [Trypanosoma vivax]|nr:hypothetical protein TRVL_09605 [Trypanosoma vivax]
MRKIGISSIVKTNKKRNYATYDSFPITHAKLCDRFKNKQECKNGLELLEQVEERISNWRLNKWEMRIPHLLPSHIKEKIRRQQEHLKYILLEWGKCREALNADINLVSSITGIKKDDVAEKNRAWLQEEVGKLRWMGEVNKATSLRDAFMRLEAYGSRDHMLLERLCCIYGLACQGTFEDAFSNYILEDPLSKKIYVDEQNPFQDLVAYIINTYPQIDIIYAFLGFDTLDGYRSSLRKYLQYLHCRSWEGAGSSERLFLSKSGKVELLFDYCNSKDSIISSDDCNGMPDFLYLSGTDIVLITIASDNPWMRNRQLPHRKQMEGIARRACFVFGIPHSKIRIRNLLLPPAYLDRNSIVRLNETVFCLSTEEQNSLVPWLPMYQKNLDPKDIDFSSLMKSTNEEEWLCL